MATSPRDHDWVVLPVIAMHDVIYTTSTVFLRAIDRLGSARLLATGCDLQVSTDPRTVLGQS